MWSANSTGGSATVRIVKCLLSLIRADALETLQSDVVRWVGEQNKTLHIETKL